MCERVYEIMFKIMYEEFAHSVLLYSSRDVPSFECFVISNITTCIVSVYCS